VISRLNRVLGAHGIIRAELSSQIPSLLYSPPPAQRCYVFSRFHEFFRLFCIMLHYVASKRIIAGNLLP